MFQDRVSAGRRLAVALQDYRRLRPVVLGIPRGGVVVAAEVAAALDCELDLVILRKIGAPGNPELAIGATAGEQLVVWNHRLIDELDIPQDYLDQAVAAQNREVDRRRRLYLGEKPAAALRGKTILLVDDGLATGYTALAAARAIKAALPEQIVLAVPVGPVETVLRLREEVDDVVCLLTPKPFFAVGQFYEDFTQVSDEEVVATVREQRTV